MASTKSVVVLHPDLGIGGAERLIVDLCMALKHQGHSVTILTAHHNPSHCFRETKDGSLPVICVGDWLPRSVFGLCFAVCAYLRMIYVALYLVLASGLKHDLIVCDQISACIPFLKLLSDSKVLFYCHFPDQLLTMRTTALKRLYRAPLDWLEERTTGMADTILVNSNFTAEVFQSTFQTLRHIQPAVLHPPVPVSAAQGSSDGDISLLLYGVDEANLEVLFVSINRYERKKNIALALKAYATLQKKLPESVKPKVHLVIAGGYDKRVDENREYHTELVLLANELGVEDRLTFLRSISDDEKQSLLRLCTCLIYTPDREHFGIVPIEAMLMGKPVIAVNSGGPKETVIDGTTGYLCEPDESTFQMAMQKFVEDPFLSARLGTAGQQHVRNKFSFETFAKNLNGIVLELTGPRPTN